MDRELNGFDTTRQPNGEITYTDRITGEVTRYYTAQCVHCGLWWMVQPGSGRKRGYCLKCPGLLCGNRACMIDCKYVEKGLEEEEAKGKLRQLEDEKKAEEVEKKFGKVPLIR